MEDKVQLVTEYRGQFGLNACLEALGLSKGTWHYRQHRVDPETRDRALKERIESIIEQHPGYGYRPMRAELNDQGERVNHKRLLRVLSTYELSLPRSLPASSVSSVKRLIHEAGSSVNLVRGRHFGVLAAFTTDFTELVYANGTHKALLISLLDLRSRWIGGWAVGANANHELALQAIDRLRAQLNELGRDLNGVIIHHDRDPVFTGHAWLKRLLLKEKACISYAERGARDNSWKESFWGRLKTENRALLREAETLSEVTAIVANRIAYYNQERRHSSLGQTPPWTFLCQALDQQSDSSDEKSHE